MTPQQKKRNSEAFAHLVEEAQRAGGENPPPTLDEWSDMLRGLAELLPHQKNHYGCLVRDRVIEGIEDVLYDVETYLDEGD